MALSFYLKHKPIFLRFCSILYTFVITVVFLNKNISPPKKKHPEKKAMPSLLGATVIMGAFTSALAGSNWTAASTAATDALYLASLANLEAVVNNGSLADYLGTMNVTQECTLENAVVRKDYLALTDAERLAYSNAVTCLFSKDPVSCYPPPSCKEVAHRVTT